MGIQAGPAECRSAGPSCIPIHHALQLLAMRPRRAYIHAATPHGVPMQQPQSNADVKNDIRQTILDANQAAREAVQTARDANRQAGRMRPEIAGQVPNGRTIMIQDPRGFHGNTGMPPQIAEISIAFFIMCAVIIIGWPLARAFGRRMDRRSDVGAVNPGVTAQLQRIEQAVDAMSIEVERISESQRFMAKLQQASSADRLAAPVDR